MMETDDKADLCFPHLLNSSCRKPSPPWTEAVLLNIVLSFISLITVALNLLVIISVSHFRQLQTPTNLLLLSLAVSDFLVGLLLMPLEIYKKITCWGNVMCSFYGFLIAHVVSASIGNIVLISVDRYVSICHPLHYLSRITLARVKYCIVLCWICAGFYRFLYLKDEFIRPGRSNSCVGKCAFVLDIVAGTVDLILNFIVPVTVIIVLYMRVFVVAVSQARAMHSQILAVSLHQTVNLAAKKSELKAARTLGVLVVVYLLCFCPFYCYSLIEVNITSKSYSSYFVFLFYFNSCVNPVIYALFYSWFRRSIKLIVTLQILQPGSCEASVV